jgi:hypothetical protein
MVAAIVRLQILFFRENRMIFSFSQVEDSRSGVRPGSQRIHGQPAKCGISEGNHPFPAAAASGSDQKPSTEMVGSDGF